MAPIDNSPAGRTEGSLELICSLKVNNMIPVHKYKSTSTGLTVMIAEVDGPIVNGYFSLATEAHDDDGLPHTLEHLIFLGSEDYPYKGVLDLLANRCYADGTNAHTDTDHTVYTMSTAGSEGFLNLMPIYLDHILYPLLTDSAYTTEVHHITGSGEDAGVVYCEMQGRENTGDSRTHLEMLRAMYPGECGYKSETGGIIKNLRESTSNSKVRKYHKHYYCPENLSIVIAGQVKVEEVLKALQPLERKIMSKGQKKPFTRPWQNPVPKLAKPMEIDVPYASDDESNGIVLSAWRGPSAVYDIYKLTACSLLQKYLTDTAVSPLQQEFVELDDPYASSLLASMIENSESVLYFHFGSVPMKKINLVNDLLNQILLDFVFQNRKINMDRMKTVINRVILETLSNLENEPHDTIASMCIGDHLYGNSTSDLNQRLNVIDDMRKLVEEPEEFWLSLLNQYFVDAPGVLVRGIPSIALKQNMIDEEKKRVRKQIENLGKDGLKEKEYILQRSTVENEKPPPQEMLTCLPVPKLEAINFHSCDIYYTDSEKQHRHFDLRDVPVYTQLNNVKTNFVYIRVFLDTSGIDSFLRPYVPFIVSCIQELPIQDGNKVIGYEEVVSQIERDTINTTLGMGIGKGGSQFSAGEFGQSIELSIQVEPQNYEKGVQWIKKILFQTIFDPDRLRIIATKVLNDIIPAKREGRMVLRNLMSGMMYQNDCNQFSSGMIQQQKFLNNVVKKLEVPSLSEKIIEGLGSLRKVISNPQNMMIFVALNIEEMVKHSKSLSAPWKDIIPGKINMVKEPSKITSDWELLKMINEITIKGCIVGIGSVESSYLIQVSECLKDPNDPDLAPLLVYLEYLTQLEGPMWKQIRGLGLSYHYAMRPQINEGVMYFVLFKSTNCLGAYREARNIIKEHLSDNAPWEETLFESAKCSMLFQLIHKEKCVEAMFEQSVMHHFKKVDTEYNRRMLSLVSKVTMEDLLRVGNKYLSPLFDPGRCKTVIVCNPGKVEEIYEGFKELGLDLEKYCSLEESFLSLTEEEYS